MKFTKGGDFMLEKISRFLIILVFAISGLLIMEVASPFLSQFVSNEYLKVGFLGVTPLRLVLGLLGLVVFGSLGKWAAPFLMNLIMRFSERMAMYLADLPTSDIFVLAIGVILGLIVAALLGTSFSRLPIIGPYISLIFSILGAIVGAKVALNKRTDIVSFFNRIWFSSRVKESSKKTASHVSRTHKLLDTSVLIDGRILEIIRLGFLEGTIIIPKFVLEELQKIADSADTLKRNRGRRGLDIVQEIKDLKNVSIEIVDKDFDDLTEVDAKLVRLAAQMKGVLATNDFNLSKVAKIQGVPVLNVNDLANALKQAVLPGEELRIFLAKEGKEQGQAIGYLDDGTMVVVENGKRSVNQTVPVTVTSVLQTSAGRMIFAKMK
ncbi:MAG: TRAM domain-containing protein [Acidaminococcus intestini]|jgi:hypothetical protein|uniref:TRAM domain-containing protein n=4 Tax=Acidaminococcaceae TaxID=909930 RepID=G4Q684_ACIIR|nr:conserved hypothetical protein [Acidaminococcus intestini RyC-MR95]EEH91357.1 PIN domain protein [Acidaminococcus intestini]MBS6985160.1 TRAM domain-containing protein [Acidaminococcus intestini]RJU35700.1 PIN/TRAM domain-containing protein [Acidaminococcus sp. AM33-14BH]